MGDTKATVIRINELERRIEGFKAENGLLSTELAKASTTIDELTKKLASTEQTSNTWYKSFTAEKEITDSLHDVLDGFGIRRFRDKNEYQTIPLAVRLFSWAMSLVSGRDMNQKESG